MSADTRRVNLSVDIPTLVDRFLAMRNSRLNLQRQLDADYQQELAIKQKIIDVLSSTGAQHHVPGYLVEIKSTVEPFITDFTQLAEYIRKENALDLLQKRLTPTAVKLRAKDGIDIPGVGWASKSDLVISQE